MPNLSTLKGTHFLLPPIFVLSMDYPSLLLVLSFVWACIHVLTSRKKSGSTTLPPGPLPLQIIGNILDLGQNPHQALADLSKTYGPLMTLKLGSITTIVISSPDIAKEALQKHDHALSSRTIPDSVRVLNHHNNSMACLPASAHWKKLRKVSASHMFTSQRLDSSQGLRRKKVQELLDYVNDSCVNSQAVDIGRAAFTTVLNLISNTFFSIDLTSHNSCSSQELNDLVIGIMEEAGTPNIADYFPILRFVDPQGTRRRMKSYFERLLVIFDGIINERTQQSASSVAAKANIDVIDSLLFLSKEPNSELSLADIKHLLLDFFVAGTDTSSSTVEWAMAELLQNPKEMAKLTNELKQVDGPIQESDFSKLPYLQAIVKETFRLHPPAPFLIPHKAEFDVEISGFKVPKNAQILINIWATGRDPSLWPNPDLFSPERFLRSEIDVKGRDFELIPFGAGRRICPGLPLGHRMVHLMLASLVHAFDWKFVDGNGMTAGNVDMTAQFGLTLHKRKPLLAIPTRK